MNDALDKAQAAPFNTARHRSALSRIVRDAWSKAKPVEGQGHWDKVLKRFYLLAGRARARRFRHRALRDLLDYPALAARISEYMRCTGTVTEFLAFAEQAWANAEQVYPDVNVAIVEETLRLEPTGAETRRLRSLAHELIRQRRFECGKELCAAVAPLLLLRYADRRASSTLRSVCERLGDRRTPRETRAAAIVLGSYGGNALATLRRVAARQLTNDLAQAIRLVESVAGYRTPPREYVARLASRFDAVQGVPYIDMRTVVAARLLGLNPRKEVRGVLNERRSKWLECPYSPTGALLSTYDRLLLRRLLPR